MIADMTTLDGRAPLELFQVGINYYIMGRAAVTARLIPIDGNLLQHGVELMLKSELSKTTSLNEIKKQFRHRLPKIWNA